VQVSIKLGLGLSVALITVACASARQILTLGSRPADVVGQWVDITNTRTGDTMVVVLTADGNDRTLHIALQRDAAGRIVTQQRETWSGFWYVKRSRADSTDRAICVRSRAREGAVCSTLSLGFAADDPARKRLIISDHVLLARLP
jgi:hypothetical protein